MNGFENSLEHLMAELERIDLRIRLRIERWRQRASHGGEDEFRGLYISEEEIDSLIAAGPAPAETPNPNDPPLANALAKLEHEIAGKKARSIERGVPLRLHRITGEFGLNEFETDALLICLLPEIDTKYERLYAYLHDDVTRKRPSVNLVLQCLADSLDERLAFRDSFLPQSPLMAHHLLRVEDESGGKPPPLLVRNLKIDDRIVNYLLGSDKIDPRLSACARLIRPSVTLESMVLPDHLRKSLSQMAHTVRGGHNYVLYLQGPFGIGKKTAAESLARSCGVPVFIVDVPGVLANEIAPEISIALAFREAKLQEAAICWDRIDVLLAEDKSTRANLQAVIEGARDFPGPIFMTGQAAWQPGDTLSGKTFVRVEFEPPSYDIRRHLWEVYLNGGGPRPSPSDLEAVADKFRFTPGQIKDAAATARNLALSHGEAQISAPDLYAACRVTSNLRLTQLARKIQSKYSWNDIVLPKDQMAQLREIANYVKYRHVVFADWRFESKISLGKGLNILFAGPSGTGKTMAAEIIAHELGLDLYKIDLSTIISKYIGETEKNLDRIFTEAQNSNAILFFDEADAVFGKRSEVRDSHDRYANIEVAYLLQKMEEYDGIVVLATNLRKNLDEAFARRMHFSVEFPQPEEPDRLRIWRGIFPREAPISADVDLAFMARQFKITGGNIKNVALGAAFLAAGDGGKIKMEHLIRATKREFQKIGRLCTEADFAKYFDLVKG